ncbi:MAG: adenylate/guanylate cyclase domain-containing protein [Stellaceae bacterium]
MGSTALAARLDPEEWRETVAGYQREAAEAVTRFEGYVARYVGDGVLAFFGYPAAHDNDAERAVRASLARLLRETGRREEARAMLAEIYGWFTEGFDTANLIDAKALLEELRQ